MAAVLIRARYAVIIVVEVERDLKSVCFSLYHSSTNIVARRAFNRGEQNDVEGINTSTTRT